MSNSLLLFPLRTVLFPGGRLQLRIFEQRYLDLVSRCLREEHGFGVCLIRYGEEAGKPAEPHAVGTEVEIIDWHRLSDGLLGITVEGRRRFEICTRRTPPRAAQEADVRWLEEPGTVPPNETTAELALLLERILEQIGGLYAEMPRHLDDPAWVSGRLSELLPMANEARQQLLEIDHPLERLVLMRQALEQS